MKIGWILSGNRHIAGARLQGFLMHEEFLRRGISSEIIYYPEHHDVDVPLDVAHADEWIRQGFSCIVFQKVCGENAERLARHLLNHGIRVVYIACNLQGFNMVECCPATIAVSQFLKRTFGYRFRKKITFIEDPVEVPGDVFKRDYRSRDKNLRLVYVAGEPPSPYLNDLVLLDAPGVEITEISSSNKGTSTEALKLAKPKTFPAKIWKMVKRIDIHDWAWKWCYHRFRQREMRRIQSCRSMTSIMPLHLDWSLDSVFDRVLDADVAVIPCELQYEWSLAKSGNRLLMFMALGMPVIASPLPAYRELMREAGGEDWMIAHTRADWRKAQARWRDEDVRREMGRRFLQYAHENYKIAKVASRYLMIINS